MGVRYSVEQVAELPDAQALPFAVAADVAQYPTFVPWCTDARIYGHSDDVFFAELGIGYKIFRERFVSKVRVMPAEGSIQMQAIDGVFAHLVGSWAFSPRADGGTRVVLRTVFEFKNRWLGAVAAPLFREASGRMSEAFCARVAKLR